MNTKLPQFVIVNLYKDTLVVTDSNNLTSSPTPTQVTPTDETVKTKTRQIIDKKNYLGDNKKNISIIVNDASSKYINEEWLATLGKILEAFKLNIGDVAIVNYHQQPFSFAEIKNQLSPQFIIMFDVSTTELKLPFAMPLYQVQQYSECTLLISSFKALSSNKDDAEIKKEKRKLWESMKKIFVA